MILPVARECATSLLTELNSDEERNNMKELSVNEVGGFMESM